MFDFCDCWCDCNRSLWTQREQIDGICDDCEDGYHSDDYDAGFDEFELGGEA